MTDSELAGAEKEIAKIHQIANPRAWNRSEWETRRAELIMRLRVTNIRLEEVIHNSQRVIIDTIDWLSKETE
jgi:hypothetical protein